MPIIAFEQDAFGRALLDHAEGRGPQPLILETDDGRRSPAMSADWFFEPPEAWVEWERTVPDDYCATCTTCAHPARC